LVLNFFIEKKMSEDDNERGETPLVPLNEIEDQILGNNRASSRESGWLIFKI
jgi:hypothetical protein